MKRIHKFLQLSWRDQSLLIQAILVLATVALGLRVLPWSTLRRQSLRLANWSSRSASTRRPSVQQIARVIQIASSLIPKATCLPRALTAQFLLIQNAHPAELQIGVARDEAGKLEAHAWVTSDNDVIIGGVPDPDRFVPLSHMERQAIEDYANAT